ncbi:signal peptidase I [uncultured Anaerotruncus sp.]|uniref:signal peptidase I n=1 Tax=uncultured Anaerotruncus sp. TaxID=905011 RepID=UPI00280A5C4D|nr:signal peptidase I [uncultured Anaerotruncus sp.]
MLEQQYRTRQDARREHDFRYDIKNSLNTRERRRGAVAEVYEWVESCVIAVGVILLVFAFAARTATVSGPSMLPTLHDGDRLLLVQAGYRDPQYGDVVVVDRSQRGEPPIIKRVIGRAGDEIDIDFETGQVRRNGRALDEPYLYEPTLTRRDVEFPVTVPEGSVFVMGDNRNHSADSRTREIGMIDLRRVMGKAVYRFLPADRAGKID